MPRERRKWQASYLMRFARNNAFYLHSSPFPWNPQCLSAFREVKSGAGSSPTLHLFAKRGEEKVKRGWRDKMSLHLVILLIYKSLCTKGEEWREKRNSVVDFLYFRLSMSIWVWQFTSVYAASGLFLWDSALSFRLPRGYSYWIAVGLGVARLSFALCSLLLKPLSTDSFVSLLCRFCQSFGIGILLAKPEGDGSWLVQDSLTLLYK